MENLRKVVFTVNPQSYATDVDKGFGKMEPEKNGVLHCFGNRPIFDDKANRWVDNMMAIIEEDVTGKVYVIKPECIDRFVPEEVDESNGMTIL